LAVALFAPVRQSSVGQAEVAPLQYTVMSAPLDGVIASIAVKPNESVTAGDVLFRLDDTSLRSRLETARRSLGVVRSEAFLSRQKAFSDVQARSEVATQEARITEKGSTISYLATMVEKVTVRAPHPGVVLFGDASDWEGKPVSVGERIMTLADSRSAGVTVWLPVADALDLEKGAEVRLFLHTDPLHPRTARTIRSSFLPVLAPDGTAAYRLTAEFVGQADLPRLGLRGTAKVYGSRVPLAYYLFRRPLAKVRQWLGV
jgi:multidrug resistance efflux pump